MGTIVVGYVPKPEGRAAVECAAREAQLRSGRVLVVSSHQGDVEPGTDAGLAALEEELSGLGIEVEVRETVRALDAAEDLLNVARESAAELIVIGLRRRTPVGKLVLGNNAQRILLDAPCPVLAVKAD